MKKKCFKCNRLKPLTEYYRHACMRDGYLRKCKDCVRVEVAEYSQRPDQKKKRSEYERKRFKSPARKAAILEYQRARRGRNKLKAIAWNMISNGLRDGKITRKPCQVCGNPKSEAHHHDYSKPLDVIWLCFKHHREIGHQQKVN